MSKEPGQELWEQLWGALSFSWQGAHGDAKATYASVESAIRAAALEEAAKLADERFAELEAIGNQHPENSEPRDRCFAKARCAASIAADIRALKERKDG